MACKQGYLGLKLGPGLWALICLGLLNRSVGPMKHSPPSISETNHPLSIKSGL